MTLDVFIGYDQRQPVSFTAAAHSIIKNSSKPVAIHPLVIETLPISRVGLTPFTWSRFLVPYLMNYRGHALFLDADVLVLGDIAELFEIAEADERKAVHVVKGDQKFEWSAVMMFNCGHYMNSKLQPGLIERGGEDKGLHKLGWLAADEIGEFPREWAHTVLYDQPRMDAKLVHFTAGVPAFPEVEGCEYSAAWETYAQEAVSTIPWLQLMGTSVHVARVIEHMKRNGLIEKLGYQIREGVDAKAS